MRKEIYLTILLGMSVFMMNAQCTLENQDFEDWNSIAVYDSTHSVHCYYDSPDDSSYNWFSSLDSLSKEEYINNDDSAVVDSFSVFKSANAYSGNYSLGLQINPQFGSGEITYTGACDDAADIFTGFVNLTGDVSDSLTISVAYSKDSTENLIIYNDTTIGASNNGWTEFSINIGSLADSVDTVKIQFHLFTAQNQPAPPPSQLSGPSASTPLALIDNLKFLKIQNSVVSHQGKTSISLYPNPNDGNFTINFGSGNTYTVNITDINGKVIYSDVHNQSNNSIDINRFENGVYFLQVNGNNEMLSLPVVVCK